jgi:phage terminase large subunit-like protein
VSTFWLPRDGLEEKARQDRVPYDRWHDQGLLEAAPGRTIDYEFVAERLREIFSTYDVQAVGFDRWGFEHLKQHLERAGFDWDQMEKFKPFGQGFKDMSPALRALEGDILNKRLAHGGHPVLSMCAANATVQMDPAGNRKLVKQVRHRRIDGMVALAMARGVASAQGYDGFADIAPGAEIAMWV